MWVETNKYKNQNKTLSIFYAKWTFVYFAAIENEETYVHWIFLSFSQICLYQSSFSLVQLHLILFTIIDFDYLKYFYRQTLQTENMKFASSLVRMAWY